MPHHEAKLDALAAQLEAASLIEQYTDDEGKPALRLTARRAQVGPALAMAGDAADAEVVLAALLDAREA